MGVETRMAGCTFASKSSCSTGGIEFPLCPWGVKLSWSAGVVQPKEGSCTVKPIWPAGEVQLTGCSIRSNTLNTRDSSNQPDRLDHSNPRKSQDYLFLQVWVFGAVNIMVVLKFGYYIAARSPLNSHTNTGAYAYSPHFKNIMLDLAYVISLFVNG
ncbi:hypothetical protein SAMN05444673_7072 [Bacillus sp. OV166]|uniref:hypothetical protein n=1 Tax=Bacillus sp. OV166 TaxID=1882763 RepID=UPI000A2AC10A|nr:hypothetical protein [Bacillus sp. OV166]SMQ86978.1 hypothetical protein SAMN05444673_7072 [Bacillus sp. OV166]